MYFSFFYKIEAYQIVSPKTAHKGILGNKQEDTEIVSLLNYSYGPSEPHSMTYNFMEEH